MSQLPHTGEQVLAIARLKSAGSRNEGRYHYSEKSGRLRHYWATVGRRAAVDHFGIQFVGVEGQCDAARFEAALESAGFTRRRDTRNNATFAQKIPFKPDGFPDAEGILRARATLDAILNAPNTAPSGSAAPPTPVGNGNFATELRNSLPFFIDLELPERSIEAPREIVF
jgi:hypothetical protein